MFQPKKLSQMIQLQQNQLNQTIVVTLSELKNPLIASNWLFVFTLEQDDSYVYKLFLNDISTNVARYNKFIIDLPTDVAFKFLGDYQYECYQMPDTNDTNQLRGELVEIGKMRLLENSIIIPTFTPNTNTNIYEANI